MVRIALFKEAMTHSHYQCIYQVVHQIPAGTVATYGDVARWAGLARHARLVGYALHHLPAYSDVPWQRVVNAQGGISLGKINAFGAMEQRELLEQEGVSFKTNGRIDLKRFRWQPDPRQFPHDIL
ncbi:MGMT family protein [Thiolinea disciformis]|uniref:MGMT family protein n=1 Tax=Thiolinea disciformis TaxID=125614 RepID=UPI00037194E3|nr:MGMT family protein [Thiolinea disciformis]